MRAEIHELLCLALSHQTPTSNNRFLGLGSSGDQPRPDQRPLPHRRGYRSQVQSVRAEIRLSVPWVDYKLDNLIVAALLVKAAQTVERSRTEQFRQAGS